jgi:tetratricopeptide (TPR) repeat protein
VTRRGLIGILVVVLVASLAATLTRIWTARRYRSELAEASREMDAGLFGFARARLARLAELRLDDGEVAYQLGQCDAERGRFDAALEAWSRVRPGSPWSAPAALDFAQVAIKLGRLCEAERVLRAGLRRPSAEMPALRHLLLTLLGQQGRFADARHVIEALWDDPTVNPARAIDDRLAMLHEHVGLDFEPFPLEWNLGQLGQAAKSSTAADQRAMAVARAYLASRSGDFERARTTLEECLKRWPDDPSLWKSWLDWTVAAGQPALTRQALDHVSAGQLEAAEFLDLRAWLARARNEHNSELRALQQLIAIEPGRAAAVARLAELFEQGGDSQAAAAWRQRKSELDAASDRYHRLYKEDQFSEHLPELASLAERLGRWFEARAFWSIVTERDPSNRDARPALARLDAAGSMRSRPEASVAALLADELEAVAASPRPDLGQTGAGRGPIP